MIHPKISGERVMHGLLVQPRNILLALIIAVSGCSGCSKKEPNEPVSDDLSDLKIDPDQRALPAEGAGVSPAKETESVPQKDAPPEVPPTPTAEELDAGASPSEPETVEPDAPVDEGAVPSADSGQVEGSGPQVRYVKAAELNVRQEPNRHSKIVGKIFGGAKVRVKIQGGWARLDSGRWIRSRWLVKARPKHLNVSEQDNVPPRNPESKKKSKKKSLTKIRRP